MIKTVIKYSTKLAKLEKFNTATAIEAKIKKHIEFKEYHIIYNGVLESGIELNFFEDLDNSDLLSIHIILKNSFKDYSCYYVNNSKFEGCIKEFLFNQGCGVKGVWKEGFKQEVQVFQKPIINTVKKVINKKNKGGRPKYSKNKVKHSQWFLDMQKQLASIK